MYLADLTVQYTYTRYEILYRYTTFSNEQSLLVLYINQYTCLHIPVTTNKRTMHIEIHFRNRVFLTTNFVILLYSIHNNIIGYIL